MKSLRRLVIKTFLLVIILVGIANTYKSFNKVYVDQYRQQLQRSITVKINNWYSNFLSSNLHLNNDPDFLSKLQQIKDEKTAKEPKEFWDVTEQSLPLQVDIPKYFYEKSESDNKPDVQPFDPRLTLSIYLDRIKARPNDPIQFHWGDWVDLSKLNEFFYKKQKDVKIKCENLFDISKDDELIRESRIVPVKEYCKTYYDDPLGFKVKGYAGPQTVENNELLSKAYLYSNFENPFKVVFLAHEGSYEVNVKGHKSDTRHSLLFNGYVELFVKDTKEQSVNVLDKYNSLIQHTPPNKEHILDKEEIELDHKSFDINIDKIITELESQLKLSLIEANYLNSLKFSRGDDDPPKYFNEAKLLESHEHKWLGDHYDWRFFNGLTVGNEDQIISLHRLIKNYLNFTKQHGIITWIAHGTLLSWYWNGISFPWDTDLDVQMPIDQLHKLSRHYNQTLIVENVGDDKGNFNGMGKYFIDVGSSINYRTKGNGNNNIDARFIDVDTGLYVDITGLSVTDIEPPSRYEYLLEMNDDIKQELLKNHKNELEEIQPYYKNKELRLFNCRNNHFQSLEELSPLKLVMIENQLSYIPTNFKMMLNNEYNLNSMTEKNYRDYIYLNNFKIWVKTQIILDYINDQTTWMKNPKISKRVVSNVEKFQINKLTKDDHFNLLNNDIIFKEVYHTFNLTTYHELEIKRLNGESLDVQETQFLDHFDNKSIRPDLFLNKIIKSKRS